MVPTVYPGPWTMAPSLCMQRDPQRPYGVQGQRYHTSTMQVGSVCSYPGGVKQVHVVVEYTFNRKNDNDMRGQLYHDVLRLQGHLPRVAGVPAIVS